MTLKKCSHCQNKIPAALLSQHEDQCQGDQLMGYLSGPEDENGM